MKNLKIFLLLGLMFFGAFVFFQRDINIKPNIVAVAESVKKSCKDSEVKSVCYETEIPKLMKLLSMEDSFNVASLIQSSVPDFPYCHVLGHKLASLETKKDPSKWKEVVARCPRGTCSNGCVHGAFQERYRNDILTGESFSEAKNELTNLCEKSDVFTPTGLEQGSCYHALGHLLMYITGADVNKSVLTCDGVAKKEDGRDFTRLCYAGAFMQIFQPLDTDDKTLIRNINVDKSNAWDFCSKFPPTKKNICREESWPLFLEEISIPQGLVNFCSVLDTKGQESCIMNIFYLMPIQFRFNTTSIDKYCSGFSENYKGKCYAMTASRMLEIDKRNGQETINYCNALSGLSRSTCFEQIIHDALFDYGEGSKLYSDFCSQVPQDFIDKCK